MYSIEKLKKDFYDIGLKKDDVVFIRADISKILKSSSGLKAKDILEVILDVVGENGTVVVPSYTISSFIKRDKKKIFTKKSRTTSGIFSMVMLANKNSFRSSHPTNSYVAIGKYAKDILKNHDENSGAYEPMRRIMELQGKMLQIGCASTSLGFITHLVEADLKFHRRLIFPTLLTTYYERDGKIKLFKRKDPGMCVKNYYKLFGLYVQNEVLKQGDIGGAYSLFIDAKDAYKIDYNTLKSNIKFNICDDKECFNCRVTRWDNISPLFILKKIINKIVRKVK